MKSKLFIALIISFTWFSENTFAGHEKTPNKDIIELLDLVKTDKDYEDAITLIEEKYSTSEADADVKEKVKNLAKKHNANIPEWVSEEFDNDEEPTTGGKSDNDKEKKSNWGVFFAGFAGGLIALLTPCVFPMIPMTVTFFTKQSKTKAKGISNALIFGFSIIGIYVALGLIVSAIMGPTGLNELSTNVWMNIIFFVIFIVFAFSFLGAFEIRMPAKWVNRADSNADKGGMIGIFFMAFTLSLVSFSCTGPIIGTLLVEASESGSMVGPAVGMIGFSSALAIPFTLFAIFPGWLNSLPQSGGWFNSVSPCT